MSSSTHVNYSSAFLVPQPDSGLCRMLSLCHVFMPLLCCTKNRLNYLPFALLRGYPGADRNAACRVGHWLNALWRAFFLRPARCKQSKWVKYLRNDTFAKGLLNSMMEVLCWGPKAPEDTWHTIYPSYTLAVIDAVSARVKDRKFVWLVCICFYGIDRQLWWWSSLPMQFGWPFKQTGDWGRGKSLRCLWALWSFRERIWCS